MPILQHTVFIAPYLLPYPNLTVSLPLVYYSYLSGINNFYCCSEKRLTNLTFFRCHFIFLPSGSCPCKSKVFVICEYYLHSFFY
nr:MAG TPA: hypothetical protein [Caudoviricetes sp.]